MLCKVVYIVGLTVLLVIVKPTFDYVNFIVFYPIYQPMLTINPS